jgi:hypothetical protein
MTEKLKTPEKILGEFIDLMNQKGRNSQEVKKFYLKYEGDENIRPLLEMSMDLKDLKKGSKQKQKSSKIDTTRKDKAPRTHAVGE